jgi:hypothetical protein
MIKMVVVDVSPAAAETVALGDKDLGLVPMDLAGPAGNSHRTSKSFCEEGRLNLRH